MLLGVLPSLISISTLQKECDWTCKHGFPFSILLMAYQFSMTSSGCQMQTFPSILTVQLVLVRGLGLIWTYGIWPQEWFRLGITKDITVLELFPILVAIEVWGQYLCNKKILFKCDNQAVCHILNSLTSKSDYVMVLVRAITLRCLHRNIVVKAEHLAGIQNDVTDSLSRLQMARFRKLAPEADLDTELVPDHLWNIFKQESDNL